MLLPKIEGSLNDFLMILKSLHDHLRISKVQFLLNNLELVKCGITSDEVHMMGQVLPFVIDVVS